MKKLLALTLILGAQLAQAAPPDAREINRKIGRGINLGNALEAPKEGEWGLTLEEGYFEAIKEAGFDSVRIPIKWSAHAKAGPPYTIDPTFFERIDWAIEQALARGLAAVINIHHFDGLDRSPDESEPMIRAIWKQIAERYRERPPTLVFELDNEPHDKLTTERWNARIRPLLETIRDSNPRRTVIVGPGMWNGFRELKNLKLPEGDRNLIVTFHYYEPFEFTHQGAEWAGPKAREWLGRTWTGTPDQQKKLREDFDVVANWAKEHDRPIFLGEFGAYGKGPMDSRTRWTRAVAEAARSRDFSYAYWEFGAGFGAYDRDQQAWREPLKQALLAK